MGEPKKPEIIFRSFIGEHEKRCSECGSIKPKDSDHFHKDSSTADGFVPICKICRADLRRKKREQEIHTELAKYKQKVVDQLAKGKGAAEVVNHEEYGTAFFRAIGSMEEFARELVEDYYAAQRGSAARTKLGLGIAAILERVTEKVQPVDLSSLSEEELLERLISQVKNGEERTAALGDQTEG